MKNFAKAFLLGLTVTLTVSAAPGAVLEINLDEIIQPVVADYVVAGIDQAEKIGAEAVFIRLNTPGGLETGMRRIVDRITSSRVPVIVYVAPTGAHAASAGFFILMAADVAVMAPGTTTGAASPVAMGGAEIPETLKKKILSDAAAYLRSYTSKRGRNPEQAELAVTEAKSFTDEEALNEGLIDAVAQSRQIIFQQFDGKSVRRFDGTEQTLALAGAAVESWTMTNRQRFLSRLADPNIAFLLLIFGILGLYIEFNNPGFIVPGVVGGICLVLALFSLHLLPVNYVGVLLIVLAVVLFILEAMFASHGVLAVGGVVSMVLGALMLVESPPIPEMRVRTELAVAVAIPFGIITIVLLRLVLRARRWRVATGSEDLVGAVGEVRQRIDPGRKGLVLVTGELWRAVGSEKLSVGQQIRVVGMDGLLLRVEPYDKSREGDHRAGKE